MRVCLNDKTKPITNQAVTRFLKCRRSLEMKPNQKTYKEINKEIARKLYEDSTRQRKTLAWFCLGLFIFIPVMMVTTALVMPCN